MGINPGTITGLPSHRFLPYVSSENGDFVLVPRLQALDLGADLPKEIIDEIGNVESAGIVTDTARVSATLRNFIISSLMPKLISEDFGSVGAVTDVVGTSFTSAPTKIKVVAPIKKTGTGVYTLKALTSTTFEIKDSTGALIKTGVASYDVGDIVTDVPGLQLVVQEDSTLTNDDTATFTVSESSSGDINTDFSDAKLDILVRYRNPAGTFYVSEYIQGASLQSMNYNLSVGGNAEESYTIECDNRTLYNGNIVRASYHATSSDDTNTTIDLDSVGVIAGDEALVQTKSTGFYGGNYFLKVVKYDSSNVCTILEEVAATPSAGQYSFNDSTNVVTFGDDISSGDMYQFTYLSQAVDTSHAYGEDFQRYSSFPAVKTRKCPVKITGTGAATQVLYPQAVSLDLNFNKQRIEGIGMGDAAVYSTADVVKVSGSLNVNITDLSFDRLISQGSSSASVDEISVNEYADYGTNSDLDLKIEIQDPSDSTTVIYTIDAKGIVPGSAPITVPLNGIATKNIDFELKKGDVGLTY